METVNEAPEGAMTIKLEEALEMCRKDAKRSCKKCFGRGYLRIIPFGAKKSHETPCDCVRRNRMRK